MIEHSKIGAKQLREQIKARGIRFGGNKKLKIYGTLDCRSGKRMKRENRVFFTTEDEALKEGYRPCGHCMRTRYLKWKNTSAPPI